MGIYTHICKTLLDQKRSTRIEISELPSVPEAHGVYQPASPVKLEKMSSDQKDLILPALARALSYAQHPYHAKTTKHTHYGRFKSSEALARSAIA